MKCGPSRGELLFRLVFSVAGLAFLAVALAIQGIPAGPAFVELGLLAGGFLGGTAAWFAWRLFRGGRR